MRLQDSINPNDLASLKRGFSRLWALFQKSNQHDKTKLLNLAESLRRQIVGDSYEWKRTIRRIDELLVLMRKATQ